MSFSRKFKSDGEILIEKREDEEGGDGVWTTLEDFGHSGEQKNGMKQVVVEVGAIEDFFVRFS